ncbi:carbohydrate sulfotransferase 4-like [Engraulis encrasicolus]|uniref:carbohydrate sulfotransferase 4-like n=1 Tax=Engraulis encrasicolus TaxID=184585 RepID=UPI002FD1A08F
MISSLYGSSVLLICQWYTEMCLLSPSPSQGKVHVLLVSSWRSGSSFLGQVFNQHPSVFYLMEPAWHVWRKMHMRGAQELRMAVRDLLRQVLKCDMSIMKSYMGPHAKTNHLFFWTHSRALCSPPLCTAKQGECHKKCGGKPLYSAADACRKHYSHVVLKTVRIFELESLYPLLRDPTLDLRILHLVRDPRAVWRSRRRVRADLFRDSRILLQHQRGLVGIEEDYKAMETICRSHVRIYRTVFPQSPLNDNDTHLLPPLPSHTRYKMVRYEDIANDPLGQVEDIYRFVGLNMTKELHSWVHLSTHRRSSSRGAFGSDSRDMKYVAQVWRSSLPHGEVQRVQEACREAMALLGYRAVDSDKDQRQLGQDVLLPLEHKNLTLPESEKQEQIL